MKRTWAIVLAVALIYLLSNVAAVFVPLMPGMGVFILWGLLLPLLSAVIHWFWLAKRRFALPLWWQVAAVLTAFYGVCGLATVYIVGMMWAVV